MHKLLLCLSLITLTYTYTGAQMTTTQRGSEGLRDFMKNSGGSRDAFQSGRGFYVPEAASTVSDDLRFGFYDFRTAIAISNEGRRVVIEARYNRETSQVEVYYIKSAYLLSGDNFPSVSIGPLDYQYRLVPIGTVFEGHYLAVAEGGLQVPYSLLKLYSISQLSNPPINRGIASTSTKRPTWQLDSTYYLTGLRPLSLVVPKRLSELAANMNDCELRALKAVRGRYKRNEAYLKELTVALNTDCEGNVAYRVEEGN